MVSTEHLTMMLAVFALGCVERVDVQGTYRVLEHEVNQRSCSGSGTAVAEPEVFQMVPYAGGYAYHPCEGDECTLHTYFLDPIHNGWRRVLCLSKHTVVLEPDGNVRIEWREYFENLPLERGVCLWDVQESEDNCYQLELLVGERLQDTD